MLERYPYLRQAPSDAPDGLDTPLPPPPPVSWNDLGTLVPINPVPVAREGTQDEDESESDDHDGDDDMTTWHDVALSIAAEQMDKVRAEVRGSLGYTTSAVCIHLVDQM